MSTEELKLWFDFLKTFGPAVLLPIIILWITSRQNRKIKQLEQQFDISKLTTAKELDIQFAATKEKRNHEKIVHSSLIKILFEVQKLHIALSGNCIDFACLDEATKQFKEAFSKYQAIISDNQIYLTSSITNKLYSFYKTLGELMISIKDIQASKMYDLAIVPVYDYSQKLADIIIEIQEDFIKRRSDLTAEFNKIELTEFRNCCGQQPPEKLRTKYYALKAKIDSLGEPITQTLIIEPTSGQNIDAN
jgi:hypothetical protein